MAAGLGSLVGGWLAGRFIKGGRRPEKARLMIMFVCALMMPLSPMVAYAPSAWGSLAIASIIAFAHLAWLTNISAMVVDVVPKVSLGTVFGIVAAGSSVGAIVMNDMVAQMLRPDAVTKLVSPSAYNSWFWLAAGLHLIVVPVLYFGVVKRRARLADSR